MTASRMPVDPDVGIPDLVRRLSDDSKRLVGDEVRLAKLEVKESLATGGKGAMWLGSAFGVGVVALIMGTLFLITLIGRLVNGHMWLGALVTGVIEIVGAVVLIKHGLNAFKKPSYTLEQTLETLKRVV